MSVIRWFLRHKILTFVIILLFFAVPLIAVHFLFKWKTGVYLLESEWSAGEIIGYIAGFEAFIGAVFLGIAAIYQNKAANDINDKLLNLQEEEQRFRIKDKASPVSLTPVIADTSKGYYVFKEEDDSTDKYYIANQEYEYMSFVGSEYINSDKSKTFIMVVEIENISKNIINQIDVDNFKLYDIFTNASGVSKEKGAIREYVYNNKIFVHSIKRILKPGEKIKICFKIEMDEYDLTKESFHISFDLSTTSVYNVIFYEKIRLQKNNALDENDRVFTFFENSGFKNVPEDEDM